MEKTSYKSFKALLAVFEGIDDIIYVSDPDTYELLYLNDAFKSHWGNQAIGKKCYRVLQNRDSPCPFCTNDRIFGDNLGQRYVWEFQNEVNHRWYRCSDKAVQWYDGEYKRFEIATDITAEKEIFFELEQQQRESSVLSQIAEVFLTTPDDKVYALSLNIICDALQSTAGVFGYFDTDGQFICAATNTFQGLANQSKGQLLLVPEEQFTSNSIWVEALETRQMTSSKMPSETEIQASGQKKTEMVIPLVDNEQSIGLISVWRNTEDYTDNDKKLIRYLGKSLSSVLVERRRFEIEMARRRIAETRLKIANKDLTRSNKELEQFAYVASHDLQEPLRMVSSFTQLLQQKYENELDEKAQKYISYAVDGAIRMQQLIQDLLQYSRVRSRGKAFSAVDLHTCLGIAIVNLRMAIEESGAIITNDELPAVVGDETQLSQVFQNLISNALKFRNSVVPHIHISTTKDDQLWRITVSDNGIGISPEHLERIFQIFQRLHSREKYPGTGIGLPLCQRIVQRHGGTIWAESDPGHGSRFHFTLPEVQERTGRS